MKIEVRDNKVIIDGYVNAVDRFSKILYDKRGQFVAVASVRIQPLEFVTRGGE